MIILKDFLKIFLIVFALYAPASWFSIQRAIDSYDQVRLQNLVSTLTGTHQRIRAHIESNDVFGACAQLQAEQKINNISSFYLSSVEGSCSYPPTLTQLPPISTENKITTFEIRGVKESFIYDHLNSVKWAIGKQTPIRKSIYAYFSQDHVVLEAAILELFNVLYVCAVVVFILMITYAKEISQFLRGNSNTNILQQLFFKLSNSIQLSSLIRLRHATKALDKRTKELSADIDLLETSLESSILNEIKENGRSVPYSFKGTVAKVDINGFSRVVANAPGQGSFDLTNNLEEFGCELLRRYGGLFEKTVGDEIVVVFRNENSELKALAFLRDLMQEFSELEFPINSEQRRFTLKGSLCSSQINFRKRPSGYGFDGDALTHAARLVDTINIKDQNVLSIFASDLAPMKDLIASHSGVLKFEFKNMGTSEGYWLTGFKNLAEIILIDISKLDFFKSDEDIIFLLKTLHYPEFQKYHGFIFSSLRKISVNKCKTDVIQTWKETVQKEMAAKAETAQRLCQIIMLGQNLVPTEQWTSDCTALLTKIDRTIDDRINSSIVEVLTSKDLSAALEIVIEKEFPDEYRTQGDLLIAKLLGDLNNFHLNKLLKMLKSKIEKQKNTAIYCACVVLNTYQKSNIAILETFPQYRTILSVLKSAQSDDDLSPRLKALVNSTLSMNTNNTELHTHI